MNHARLWEAEKEVTKYLDRTIKPTDVVWEVVSSLHRRTVETFYPPQEGLREAVLWWFEHELGVEGGGQ